MQQCYGRPHQQFLQVDGDRIAIIEKSYFLHERDEKGELKALLVEIEPGKEVKIIPIPEGEIALLSDPIKGYEVLSAHIVEPKLSPDEIKKFGKTKAIALLVQKLLDISDIKESFRPESGSKGKAP